jgi:anti-sigma regulatory factor (Ser/Thr protein kinase)
MHEKALAQQGSGAPVGAASHQTQPAAPCARAHPPTGFVAGELPAPCGPVRELAFDEAQLAGLRHSLDAWAREHALGTRRIEELVLAVDELAANSIRHGGGAGVLRFWRERDALLCEVQDMGWIRDPLVGRTRPAVDAQGGRGVWLANQLCDLVQIRSSRAGSVVRVHKRLPETAVD